MTVTISNGGFHFEMRRAGLMIFHQDSDTSTSSTLPLPNCVEALSQLHPSHLCYAFQIHCLSLISRSAFVQLTLKEFFDDHGISWRGRFHTVSHYANPTRSQTCTDFNMAACLVLTNKPGGYLLISLSLNTSSVCTHSGRNESKEIRECLHDHWQLEQPQRETGQELSFRALQASTWSEQIDMQALRSRIHASCQPTEAQPWRYPQGS
jgi:hypothetical protein